jgi:hypothetical protein
MGLRLDLYKHPYGLCVSVDKDNVIVRIPKNASSLVANYGLERNWFYVGNELHLVKPKFFHVVLRDPVERWISGVLEFQQRKKYPVIKFLEILKKIEFDEHTVPQYKFLPAYGKLYFYNMDDGGLDILLKHKFKLFPQIRPLPKINSTKETKKREIQNRIIEAMDESLVNDIKEYYAKDYKLIKEHLH